MPAEPVGVRAGAKWSEAQSTVKSKVSAKSNFLIDSWHLGADESAPELKDTDTFYANATVFVKSRPDLPDLSSIQGSGEQVKITFEVTPERTGSPYALRRNPQLHFNGLAGFKYPAAGNMLCRSEERRVGKECRSRWSPYH